MKGKLPENLVEKVDDFLRKNEIYTDIETIRNMEKKDNIKIPKNIELYITYFGNKMISVFISNDQVIKATTHDLF